MPYISTIPIKHRMYRNSPLSPYARVARLWHQKGPLHPSPGTFSLCAPGEPPTADLEGPPVPLTVLFVPASLFFVVYDYDLTFSDNESARWSLVNDIILQMEP